MWRYTSRRLVMAVPVLLGVTFVTFVLLNIVPGDPVAIMLEKRADQAVVDNVRRQLGLDKPWFVQYWSFVVNALKGDLGRSFFTRVQVLPELLSKFRITLKLAASAYAVAIVVGVSAGIAAAVHHNTTMDSATMVGAMIGICAPLFWTAILLQIFFGLHLGWLPISGHESWRNFVLPAVALGTRFAASIARITRTSMLEVIRQDYIRTALSKGLSRRIVIYKHALRNALIPVVTLTGMQVGGLMGGSMLAETVFAIPGLGRYYVEALYQRDFPVVQGMVLFTAVVFVLANLIVDLSYAFIDPRIRYDSEGD
ncbi:MAG: ABC transporter permease [Bacillota bacterium]|nr:ABC transporter permease [Bacillota bacterium]